MSTKALLVLLLASLACLRRTEGSQGQVKCVLRDNPTSGPTVLRSELVNDNYCDCLDGSDEPRTAACPGTSFECKNTGYFTRSIPSAWLSDGHCDCCDGSDEPEGTCVNHCADLMAKALGEANQKADTVRKGLAKRDEYKKLAAEKTVEDDKKVKTLKAQVDVMSKALEKAKTRVGKLEELKKLQDDMKKPETPPETDHKQESQDSLDNGEEQREESSDESNGEEEALEKEVTDSDKTLDEQDDAELSAKYSGADQTGEDGATDADDAMDDDGFDDEVDEDYNDIDEDEDNFDDHDADSEPKDEDINDDMDDDGLGVDDDFKDDVDDAEKFEEEDNELDDHDDDDDLDDDHDVNRDDHDHSDDIEDDNHDDEPDDDYNYERGDEDEEEDYNMRDDEGDSDDDDDDGTSASTDDLDMKEYDVDKLCVKLETARSPIINRVKALGKRALQLLTGSKKKVGDDSSEGDGAENNLESCLNQARDARNKLERKKSEIERQVERLEQKQGMDYGKLHGDALRMLHGKCTKTKIMQYEFEHCGFDVVRQYEHGHVIANLGKFKGWDGEMTMKYEGGDKCWNGPVRSIKVELVCGAEELVLSVEEPNRCSYFMRFATPAVCHSNLIVDIMKDFTNVSDVNKDEL